MRAVLEACPDITAVLVDGAPALGEAMLGMQAAGVADRATARGGDLFAPLPEGGDVVLLNGILHRWGDANALAILAACRAALPPHGRLVLLEPVAPEAPAETEQAAAELFVLLGGAVARTGAAWAGLLEAGGFTLTATRPTPLAVSVMEAVPSAQ
jgi:hypothetical protein